MKVAARFSKSLQGQGGLTASRSGVLRIVQASTKVFVKRCLMVLLSLTTAGFIWVPQTNAQSAPPKLLDIEYDTDFLGILVGTTLTFRFNQPVDIGTSAFAIHGGGTVAFYSVGERTNVTSTVVTLTQPLQYHTKYTVYVRSDRITAAGNPDKKLDQDYQRDFWTQVLTSPYFYTQPADQVLASSSSYVFLGQTVIGSAPKQYQWYRGVSGDTSQPVAGEQGNRQTLSVTGLTSPARYWVRVSNIAGTLDSRTISVYIAPVPSISSTQPNAGAVEVTPNSDITLQFSEAVDLTANAVTIKGPGGVPVPFSGLPADGVTSVTLSPGAGLQFAATYNVTVSKDQISDSIGNAMIADHKFSFTTMVPVAPVFDTLAHQQVTDGAVAVLTAQVNAGTAPLTYRWYAGAPGDTSTLLREVVATNATSDSFQTGPLAAPQTLSCWLRVTNAAEQSADSGAITVTATDKPFVAHHAPLDGATKVPVDAAILLEFSEAVNLAADAVSITSPSGTVPFSGLPASGVNGIVLTPDVALIHGTVYTVSVAKDLVRDASDNPMEETHVFAFTTLFPVRINVHPQPQSVPRGENASFTVSATGDGPLHYDWRFNGGSLGAPDTPLLALNAIQPAQTGDYSVVITGPGDANRVVSDEASLFVTSAPNQKPEWAFSEDLPAGRVGLAYSFTPALAPDDPLSDLYRHAESFSASGLPPGLKINAASGEIYGVPVAASKAPHKVRITARNLLGSDMLNTTLFIQPLPAGIEGVFTGKVARSALLSDVPGDGNGALGGRLDFKVAKSGKASGKLVIGAKPFAFRSAVQVDPLDNSRATLKVNIRRNQLSDLVLDLAISGDGLLTEASVSDQVALVSAAIEGWRNPWSRLRRATELAGYYTVKLDLDGTYTAEEAPLGSGFLSFTVNEMNGRLTLTGRLADGSAVTMATFAGPGGEILLYRSLYPAKARGSVLGRLSIGEQPDPSENTVEGEANWWRPANLVKSNRLYRDGFPGLLNLLVEGGRYSSPDSGSRLPSLTNEADVVELIFSEAGVEIAGPLVTADGMKAEVQINGKARFSSDPTINTRKASLVFNSRTGAFKAGSQLSEPNPLWLPDKVVNVKRSVTGRGLIVGNEAVGYFLLNQLPKIEGETPRNTRQLGGKVLVRTER